MRQHVNPLSRNFEEIERIPSLSEMFENPKSPLHLDIGCASGDFLFDLASENKKWNYIGIEIREKLVKNSKLRLQDTDLNNLYFSFGNVNNLFNDFNYRALINYMSSISFNFPDPWFKKRHYKRRVIQVELIKLLSNSMRKGALIFVKTDVKDLFQYMDDKILSNLNFKKLNNQDFNESGSFNPNRLKTNREKYVILNKMNIFERIYIKI